MAATLSTSTAPTLFGYFPYGGENPFAVGENGTEGQPQDDMMTEMMDPEPIQTESSPSPIYYPSYSNSSASGASDSKQGALMTDTMSAPVTPQNGTSGQRLNVFA